MLKEKAQHYFTRYPDLRILFFFDEDREFQSEWEALELDGIRKEKLENNAFNLKVKFNGDWRGKRVFLYCPQASPRTQQEYKTFPLLGQLVANRELLLDSVADFMEAYHLQRHQRSLAQKFMDELKYSTAQEVLQPVLRADRFEEPAVVRGLFSFFVNFSRMEDWELILARLLTYSLEGQEKELNRVRNKVMQNKLLDALNKRVEQFFGTRLTEVSKEELAGLVKLLKYNSIVQNLGAPPPEDPYASLKINDTQVLAAMNTLRETALDHQYIGDRFRQALAEMGAPIRAREIIEAYGPDADYQYLPDPLKWAIVGHYLGDIDYQPQQALQAFESITLNSSVNPLLLDTAKFLIYVSDLIYRINRIPTYVLDHPDEYIQTYLDDWHRIDQAYRKAVMQYRRIDLPELPQDIDLEKVKELLENHYETYLDKSNREWLKCLSEQGFDYRRLAVTRQYDFFEQEIAGRDQKVAVIISDALRYEVAQELLSEMHGDPKNEADIRGMIASIPSKTSVGMANLLPGKTFTFNEGKVSIDGISADSTYREAILQKSIPEARTVSYNTILENSQEANRELFKSPVVYIYHDVIDSTGDKRKSERRAFKAVEDAIEEVKALVKRLHSSFNVARVLVTADHGFIYNDRTIEEKAKENSTGLQAIDTHNRYELVRDKRKAELGYKIPLARTTKFTDELEVVVPFSTNRYRKQGVGHQFVHGGASLQELIVPVIESARKRKEVARKVTPVLMNQNLKIVSNALHPKLRIQQKQRLSRYEKERTITAAVYRDLEPVSNVVEMTLNATSELPSERIYQADLILKSNAGSQSVFKLKIFDKEDPLNPLIEENVINKTLIQTDFD